MQHSQPRENTEPCTKLGKPIWEHFMVDLLKHNSLLIRMKDEADQHCNQVTTDRCWLSLPWISPSQPSHSLTPCYTGTDASVHTSQPCCRSKELSWGHTQRKNILRRVCGTVSPSSKCTLFKIPLVNIAVTFFSPSCCNTGAEFWWDKPGVARAIYLFRGKYKILVTILEL